MVSVSSEELGEALDLRSTTQRFGGVAAFLDFRAAGKPAPFPASRMGMAVLEAYQDGPVPLRSGSSRAAPGSAFSGRSTRQARSSFSISADVRTRKAGERPRRVELRNNAAMRLSNQQAEALEILVVRLDVTPEPRKDRREKREKSKPGPRRPQFRVSGFRQRDDRVRQASALNERCGPDGPRPVTKAEMPVFVERAIQRRCSQPQDAEERCCSGAEDRPNHASL